MKKKFKNLIFLMKKSGKGFMDKNAFRLSASLAYNTIFSLPPLLVIIITLVSFVFAEEAVSGELATNLEEIIGAEGAMTIQDMIIATNKTESGLVASIISFALLIFSASTLFLTFQESLDSLWMVRLKPDTPLIKTIKDRLLSFLLIIGIGLMILVSMVVSSVIMALTEYLAKLLPGITVYLIQLTSFILPIIILGFLFAMIYKVLPNAVIAWKDTFVGGFITSLLFGLGQFLISFYLANADPGSAYGAAGSVIVLLVWIYYSGLVMFFGAEITLHYSDNFGSKIKPTENAFKYVIKPIDMDFISGDPAYIE